MGLRALPRPYQVLGVFGHEEVVQEDRHVSCNGEKAYNTMDKQTKSVGLGLS